MESQHICYEELATLLSFVGLIKRATQKKSTVQKGLVTVAPGLTHSQSTDACQAVHCGSASAALCAGCADTHSHSLWSDALLPALATMRICCALPPVMACPVLDHKDPEEESASSMSHAASNVLHGSQTAKCPVSLQASGDSETNGTAHLALSALSHLPVLRQCQSEPSLIAGAELPEAPVLLFGPQALMSQALSKSLSQLWIQLGARICITPSCMT